MVDARSVTIRPHPSHSVEKTEGPSSLLADDMSTILPGDLDDLELPSDFELQVQSSREELYEEEIEPDQGEAEVEDTPGDDALIAQARIDRFRDAHDRAAPVDIGPFEETKDR